jgi:hypothetical protein
VFFGLYIQRYFRGGKEGVRVREEAIDWCIYRMIADGDAKTTLEIINCTHFESSLVESSLQRLIRAGLVMQVHGLLCVVPYHAMLMHNQIREDADGSVYLETGVIKVKKYQESAN